MGNEALAPAQAGELRADGTYVLARVEKPNGWIEIVHVGKLRIRGEKEPRTISYGDYAKLLTFYSTQERLIKDRRHVAVTLNDGLVVNTADITSLEQADEERFTPKTADISDEIRNLPTQELLLDLNGGILEKTVTRRSMEQAVSRIAGGRVRIAKCHYREDKDGTRQYLTTLDKIPEALEFRKSEEPGYPPTAVQKWKYGIPQF
jgi:hypothetical protein